MVGAQTTYLQNAATTDSNGVSAAIQGADGGVFLEVIETAGGTATLNLYGSTNGALASGHFPYAVGYQRLDNQASPARSVSAISITANLRAFYQILDPYPQIMAVLSSSAASNVTVRLLATP